MTMPVNKRFSGPTRDAKERRCETIDPSWCSPISDPRTNPLTLIPRVEQARRNRAKMKIKYDGQNPIAFCGPNAQRKPAKLIRIKLKLMIGRRPYLERERESP